MLPSSFFLEVLKDFSVNLARIGVSYSVRISAFFFTIAPFKSPCRLVMNGTLLIKVDFFISGSDEGNPWEID